MAKKKNEIAPKKKSKDYKAEAAAATRSAQRMANISEGFESIASTAKKRYETVVTKVKEQNSVARTLTTDLGGSSIAHIINELTSFGARSLAEWSRRTAGAEGHFNKNVGYYQSVPQTAIGAVIYALELFTRDPKTLQLSVGRDLTNKFSNILLNLGMTNFFRAVRYSLAQSVDEDQEAAADRNALLNKVAELQKKLAETKQ